MKKQSLLLLAVLVSVTVPAQNVGIGTTTPNSSSMLEIKSGSKGLLIPRTSTASRTAIVNPAKGLMVYDTTTGSFWFHNGSAWTQIETRGNNWSLKGNSGTNPGTNFIGTTDKQPLLFKVNNLPAGIIDSSKSNTAFGLNTLDSNTSGTSNTATGTNALRLNTTGYSNTANGLSALYSNSTGYANTANGGVALLANTTGIENTANGYGALQFNTTGNYNTANGFRALYSNTTGWYNTANGYQALYSNTTGLFNTATGDGALYSNTAGLDNTATGDGALYHTTGATNTANGYFALGSNTTGDANTAVGTDALYTTTTSKFNTAIGYNAGYNFDNGYNNVFLGANTDVNGPGYYNVIAIGQGTVCTNVSQVTIGNSATTTYQAYANWSNISDGRYKSNVKEDVPGLKFINELRPVTYTLDATGIDQFLHRNISANKKLSAEEKAVQVKALREKEQIRYTGFVAQEVEKTAKKLGFDFSGIDTPKNENDLYGLRYADFVAPLVKAVQEQQKIIEELEKRIEALEKK